MATNQRDPWANDPWWITNPIGGPPQDLDPGAPSNPNDRNSGAPAGGLPLGSGGSTSVTATPVAAGAGAGTAAADTVGTKAIDWGGYAKIIQAIIGAYGAIKGNKYHQAPDPMNDALRARIFGFIDNSPTRNMLGTYLQDYIKGSQGQNFSPMPNKYGYNPYPQGVPRYDMSNLLPMIQATTGNPQGAPSGGSGDPNGPDQPHEAQQMSQQLSQQDVAAFKAFVAQHGPQAGEFVASVIERNPEIGVQGAMSMYQPSAG